MRSTSTNVAATGYVVPNRHARNFPSSKFLPFKRIDVPPASGPDGGNESVTCRKGTNTCRTFVSLYVSPMSDTDAATSTRPRARAGVSHTMSADETTKAGAPPLDGSSPNAHDGAIRPSPGRKCTPLTNTSAPPSVGPSLGNARSTNAGTSNENVRASRGGVSASCATATVVNPAANDGTAHESADRPRGGGNASTCLSPNRHCSRSPPSRKRPAPYSVTTPPPATELTSQSAPASVVGIVYVYATPFDVHEFEPPVMGLTSTGTRACPIFCAGVKISPSSSESQRVAIIVVPTRVTPSLANAAPMTRTSEPPLSTPSAGSTPRTYGCATYPNDISDLE
eukprot:30087-Pelagococcus_subviridis.AAC.6